MYTRNEDNPLKLAIMNIFCYIIRRVFIILKKVNLFSYGIMYGEFFRFFFLIGTYIFISCLKAKYSSKIY